MLYLFDRIEFLIGEALVALRRNVWMTFSAVTTVTVALYLLGGLGYAYFGIHRYVEKLPDQFQIRVFLIDGLGEDQIQQVQKEIEEIKGVKEAEWISKHIAWQNQQKEMPEVTAGLDNPLPDAFRVVLSDIHQAKNAALQIQSLPAVEPGGVAYFDEERQMLTQILDLVKKLGGVLGGLMLLTSGVLIYNAIRLTILSRRREIRVMQLIGATSFTIIIPLLIEGIFQGAAGGALAAGLLAFSNISLQHMLESFTLINHLSKFPLTEAIFVLSVIGAAYGLCCSGMAVIESRKKI